MAQHEIWNIRIFFLCSYSQLMDIANNTIVSILLIKKYQTLRAVDGFPMS